VNVDEALERADRFPSGSTTAALAGEVRRLRAEQHEMQCPSCHATIRSRLADQAERDELTRLRVERDRIHEAYGAMRMRGRGMRDRPVGTWSGKDAARYILGDESEES
jgi:hypothetical protein